MDWLSFLSPITLIEKISSWFSRSKPEVNFEYKLDTVSENNFCHLRNISNFNYRLGWFFRIGITNNGKNPIKNCNVRLEKLEKEEVGIKRSASNFSPVELHWANSTIDEAKNIFYKTPVFLDIVHTLQGKDKFFIFAKFKHHSPVGVNLWRGLGVYYLHIKILGDNISPLSKIIKVDFDGNWQNLKMEVKNQQK